MMDLHTHSTYSDGSCTPRELVELAHRKGITHLALTDHDSIGGIAEAQAAAKQLGVHFIGGVEIDTAYAAELHILGLGIRTDDAGFEEWLREIGKHRGERNVRILGKLASCGIDLSTDLGGRAMEVLSRTHIADALVRRGLGENIGDAFRRYLVKGRVAYDSHPRPLPEDALAWIKRIGGRSVIAHPGKLGESARKACERLVEAGLDGIEVFYPTHTPRQCEMLLSLCERYGLMALCGSDFHGSFRPGVSLGMSWEENDTLERTRQLLFDGRS